MQRDLNYGIDIYIKYKLAGERDESGKGREDMRRKLRRGLSEELRIRIIDLFGLFCGAGVCLNQGLREEQRRRRRKEGKERRRGKVIKRLCSEKEDSDQRALEDEDRAQRKRKESGGWGRHWSRHKRAAGGWQRVKLKVNVRGTERERERESCECKRAKRMCCGIWRATMQSFTYTRQSGHWRYINKVKVN